MLISVVVFNWCHAHYLYTCARFT